MFKSLLFFAFLLSCSDHPGRDPIVARIRAAKEKGIVRKKPIKPRATSLIVDSSSKPPRPDILWIIWDATRADHLSPYGYYRDTTPNLLALSKSAYVFERAFSTGSWTTPAVAGLWTGLFSHNHRVDWDPVAPVQDLDLSVVTVAERMSALGYRTAHFNFQAIYSRGHLGWDQGFDESDESYEADLAPRYLKFKREAGDQPVFVILYWLNPHSPYEPRPEHDLWTTDQMPSVQIGTGPGEFNHALVNTGRQTIRPEEFEALKAKYDGELHQNDADLGVLWQALKEQGLAKNTAFAFTSDHGEAFGEHPDQQIWHLRPYETMLHVPLILKVPGHTGRRVKTEVRNFDLVPSFVEIAGGTVTDPMNALPLSPLFKEEGEDRPVLGAYHWDEGVVFSRMGGQKWWRQKKNDDRRLYQLTADPREQNNRYDEGGVGAETAYAAMIKQTDLGLGLPSKQVHTVKAKAALEALGYVE